ncbi:hypothetical protein [Polymorphobacter megasporae]|uniref:hypothetical protein n=1 Tax=Glacieibacterium megasporae TaxID=2835787 RepID=UPI0021074732|nr:hypothetical protein [Polymorphobacter megasporae]
MAFTAKVSQRRLSVWNRLANAGKLGDTVDHAGHVLDVAIGRLLAKPLKSEVVDVAEIALR